MGIENNIGNYSNLLRQVKQRVALAQQRAIFAANEELLRMYWDLGHIMYKAQHAEGWGKGTLARLSADMKNEYPEEKGFSERNLRYMIDFYLEYNQDLNAVKDRPNSILQPTVAELNNNTDKLHKNAITQPAVAQLPEYNFSLPMICVPVCQALRILKQNLIKNKTLNETIYNTQYDERHDTI